jgi:hypothetical protein
MKLVFALSVLLVGCGLLGSVKFPQDVLSLYECVQTQVEAGQTNVGVIASACLIQEEQLVADAIAGLLASKSWVAAHPDKAPALTAKLTEFRAKEAYKFGRTRPIEQDGGSK